MVRNEVRVGESKAYLNGRILPVSELALPVYDAGFVQGTTVAEQLRTFGGRLFRLDDHLRRLWHSLEIVGVDPRVTSGELAAAAQELAAANHKLLATGDDLGMSIFVTPGAYPTMVTGTDGPTVCAHTFPLRFSLWADRYARGESLCTTNIAQVSSKSWPLELKCRSRMHYYLADREARGRGARALMLDEQGFVTEATTANLLLYVAGRGLLTPPRHKVLAGISLATVRELSAELNLTITEVDITPDMLAAADEAMLASTSPCLLPVVRFNERPIGGGAPGPIHAQLLAAWSRRVGLDIVEQARKFASRQA